MEGAGGHYLIQHSAGSGKTNSIAWLAHRLASLHAAGDAKVFDCVVVITDRRVLDQQLQDAVYQIEHAQGVVKVIDQDAKQLAAALVDGTKIVITTLQKFPFVLAGLLHATGRAEFHGTLGGFVRLYAFLSQVVPYADPEQEMLCTFGRFLLPHLTLERDGQTVRLGDDVALAYYRLERTSVAARSTCARASRKR